MQERIVNILLVAVALLAAVLRLIGQKSSSGMTKNKGHALAHSGSNGLAVGPPVFGGICL